MRDIFALAELHHGLDASAAIGCLEGTGAIVNPGMKHAGIVAGLMGCDRGFLFQNDDRTFGVVGGQMPCGRSIIIVSPS